MSDIPKRTGADPEYAPPVELDGGVVANHRHLSLKEANEALDPAVGDGGPVQIADDGNPLDGAYDPGTVDVPRKSWRPTRKWMAALTGAAATLAASWIVTGAFDDVERGMLGTALVSLAAAYWRDNDATPGGVPVSYDETPYERARDAMDDETGVSLIEGLLIALLVLLVLSLLGIGIDIDA